MYNAAITVKKAALPLVVIILGNSLLAILKGYNVEIDSDSVWSGVVALYALGAGVANYLKHRNKKTEGPDQNKKK